MEQNGFQFKKNNVMIKNIYFIVLTLICVTINAQVGVGNTAPNGVLDTTNTTNYPIVLPTATDASLVVNPTGSAVVSGSIYYDSTDKCLKVHDGVEFNCASGKVYEMDVLCDETVVEGIYVSGNTFTTANKVTFKVKNVGLNPIGPLDFNEAVSVTSPTGDVYTVTADADYTTTTINGGGTVSFTYTLAGTPTAVEDITVQFAFANLLCNEVVGISNGGAIFEQDILKYFYSSYPDWANTWQDLDGETVELPYTDGIGNYEAFSTTITTTTGNNSDVNDVTISFPAGAFSATGSITATLSVGGSDTEYELKLKVPEEEETFASTPILINGNEVTNLDLIVSGGIIDRNFGDGTHDFIYIPVVAADGNTWLNNNLGANYANINHASFNPGQQATSANDYNAYGSLFQWGRLADGHELITYTSSSGGAGVNGVTVTNATSDTPGNNLFITENTSPVDWRVPQNNNLWQGESGINNPCPQGYRLPTAIEMDNLVSAESIINTSSAASSSLAFSASGYRNYSNGTVNNEGSGVDYWTSSVSGTLARSRYFISGGTSANSINRANGVAVRCLKD